MALNLEQIAKNINRTITTMMGEGCSDVNGSSVIDRMVKDGMLACHQHTSIRYRQLRSMAADALAKRARSRPAPRTASYPASRPAPRQHDYDDDNRGQRYVDTRFVEAPVVGFSDDDINWNR